MQQQTSPELRSWLAAIGALSAAVNSHLALPALLDLVASTAKDLLDLGLCAVMLPDQDQRSLVVAGSSGLPAQYISDVNSIRPIRLEPGSDHGAPASRAFRTGVPCMVTDVALEPAAEWTEVALSQGYRAILAVPMVATTGVVGTINSYLVTAREFSAQEVDQLQLLAEHATIALTSARILDDLREKHAFIVRSEEVHNRLLSIAARSGGLSGIAAALRELLDCEVVIRDVHQVTLASSPSQAQTRLQPGPVDQSAQRSTGAMRNVGDHVAAEVVLEGSLVATVWLLDRAGELDPLAVRAIEHATVVLSLELLRQRTAFEVERTLRGELLTDLLNGADPTSAAVRGRAGWMAHNLNLPQQLIVAAPHGWNRNGAAALSGPGSAERAAAEAFRLTSHLRPRPLVAAIRGMVVALAPEVTSFPSNDQALRRALRASTGGAGALISVISVDQGGIPAAYRTARGALGFAELSGHTHTEVTLENLGAAGLLLQYADPAELTRYAERTVGALVRYDREHAADLVNTVRTYLRSGLDRHASARSLVLHPNTVSQRLRRVEALTGASLRSPADLLELRTALMLIDVAASVGGEKTSAPE